MGAELIGEPMVPVTFWLAGESFSGVAGEVGEVIVTVRSAFTSVLLPVIVTV